MSLQSALEAWRGLLPGPAVLTGMDDLAGYASDTSDYAALPAAILKPASVAQVQQLLCIAARYGTPLHPISSGNNWGYGSANAYRPGCVVVDLAEMRAIRHFDADTGLVTLEPGVTQQQLRDWLDAGGFDHMVPTTGAGPTCSLLGNALERGYGLTPHADHFAALVALEAVLPDGSLYRSPLHPDDSSSGYRWGIGPYLDGLFSQGNLGIVTAATLALVRRPERVETFYFWLDDDRDLEAAVDAVRETLRCCGSSIGGINLISAERFLAMSKPDAALHPAQAGPPDRAEAERLARAAGAAAWTGMGAIYGTAAHVAASRGVAKSLIGRVARRMVFVTEGKARLAGRVAAALPGARMRRLARTLHLMGEGLDLLEGRPGEAALPLAYAASGEALPGQPRNPARDGCGLLWYAPVIAMKPDGIRRFVDQARAACDRHGFAAALTLTSLSERSFDSTLPILFDRQDPVACVRADACWRELHALGRAEGFLPYRVHARYARLVAGDGEDGAFWPTVARIKQAIDPLQLISPGRWHD